MDVKFSAPAYKPRLFSAKDIPEGRVFALFSETGTRYIKLSENVFLGESGGIFSAKDFDYGKSTHCFLLPTGTIVTITT